MMLSNDTSGKDILRILCVQISNLRMSTQRQLLGRITKSCDKKEKRFTGSTCKVSSRIRNSYLIWVNIDEDISNPEQRTWILG